MKNYVLYTSVLILAFFISSSFTHKANKFTLQIRGVVIAADTKQPIANAYLYIVKGEEEVLTNSKGEFSLTTSEKIPCTVTVIHKDFKQYKLNVDNHALYFKVVLQRK